MIERLDKYEGSLDALSVKVKFYKIYTDGNGDQIEVQVGPDGTQSTLGHRTAVGLGDHAKDVANPTASEKAAFENHVRSVVGNLLPPGVEVQQRLREERDEVKSQLVVMTAERDRLMRGV